MKRLLRPFIFGIGAFIAGAALADTTFFARENFGGRQIRIAADQSLPNFRDVGFNDRPESAIVEGGPWEICGDDNFGGGCTVLAPGLYPNLGAWSGRISSARPISARAAALPPPPVPSPPSGGVTFYETEDFGGRRFAIDQPVPNFARSRLNDRARSAIVDSGAWEICVDAEFRGDCRIFTPGRYPNLGGLAGRVSSARPYYEPRGDPRDRMRGRASATLYSEPNLTGRALPVGSEGASNLEGMFKYRASSLRVDRGYWIFCSGANFRGECRTFGPGEYPVLPPELDNRILSGRRISNEYPYSHAPNWR